ncbi:MAG: hypothetical protein R3E31_28155 [Chloroflexota bacterium]
MLPNRFRQHLAANDEIRQPTHAGSPTSQPASSAEKPNFWYVNRAAASSHQISQAAAHIHPFISCKVA